MVGLCTSCGARHPAGVPSLHIITMAGTGMITAGMSVAGTVTSDEMSAATAGMIAMTGATGIGMITTTEDVVTGGATDATMID